VKTGATRLLLALLIGSASTADATTDRGASPQAVDRTHLQNYKDMALAMCVANAYRDEPETARDVGSSTAALRDWANYDWEKRPDALGTLVDQYLARDYANPLVEPAVKGVRFDFLKCLDLYHSPALDALARRVVMRPTRTYRQDDAPFTRD
jgi:hypothetical protein